ncbi:MAG: molybdopterin-dependent oxidoreductase [Gammaproteobacteria bacterium]|nr:molybdopterin-dependent oxidoreductase [Gammaproteobacteria bacterium]
MYISRRSFLKGSGALLGVAGASVQLPAIANAAAKAASTGDGAGGIKYVNTICVHCVNFCGQRIKMEDGVMRVVYPNPDIAEYYNKGICPKGGAGPFNTYNPYRIKAPLKRTNPKKGPHEDPGWVEISWQEALNEIAGRLEKIRADDPRKLVWHHGHGKYLMQDKFPKAWAKAFGTPNVVHRTTTCEAARHVADELTWGYHNFLPDVEHTKLLLNFGANYFEAEQWARWLDHAVTDAKERGLELVSIEPRFSNTSAKADRWLPIRPGTDVAMLLAMAGVLIDNGYVDEEFLVTTTNAPQLVGEDGLILQSAEGEPLVWDEASGSARPYTEGVKPALAGTYEVAGKPARTAFQVLADSLKEVTPEHAEAITGVPAETIRELALHFGKTAMIGATVLVDGHRVRYRPVAVHSFRGLAAKEFGTQNWRAAQIVMMLVGAQDAVGGLHLHGVYKEPKYFEASKCEYPPTRVDLQESVYFPHATHNVCQQVAHTLLDPKAYGLPYVPEMQIFYATNRVMSTADALKQFEGYAKTWNVVIDLVLTETASLADIVLPDLSYLESWHFAPTRWTPDSKHTAIRQPLVNAYNIPLDTWGIMWELAKRLKFTDAYVENINDNFKLKKNPMQKGRDYTPKEAVALLWKEATGKPFDYAIEHGFTGKHVDARHRYLDGVEKQFKGPGRPKMKLYADQLVSSYAKVKDTVNDEKIKNLDLDKYRIALSPIPLKAHAAPTPHREADDYPIYLMTFKRMYRNQMGNTALNPILNALGDSDENAILMNPVLATELGLMDGEQARIETRVGSASGKVRITQGIRPDVVGVSYHYGHISPNFPDHAKKGTWINQALELHPDVVSGMNSFNDTKCKVVKA